MKKVFNLAVLKTVAAIIVAALIGVSGASFLSARAVHTYATATGGHRILTLPDGSIIELNTNTLVKIADNLSQRKVWLVRGEAFFQINHDARHPFVVFAGDHKITDLGTKFIVRRAAQNVQVALIEGRAELASIGKGMPKHSAQLSPGEIATASATSMSITRKPLKSLSNALGWRRGLLIFDGTTLVDAAAQFNRYNTDKIVVRDPSVAQLRVNGTFPVHARRAFVEVARAVFGLHVKTDGKQTIISH